MRFLEKIKLLWNKRDDEIKSYAEAEVKAVFAAFDDGKIDDCKALINKNPFLTKTMKHKYLSDLGLKMSQRKCRHKRYISQCPLCRSLMSYWKREDSYKLCALLVVGAILVGIMIWLL